MPLPRQNQTYPLLTGLDASIASTTVTTAVPSMLCIGEIFFFPAPFSQGAHTTGPLRCPRHTRR